MWFDSDIPKSQITAVVINVRNESPIDHEANPNFRAASDRTPAGSAPG